MHSWFCQGPGLGTRCLRVDSPWVYSICICVVCGLSYNSVWFHLSLVSTFNVGNTFILFDTIFINWHEYQPPTTETATSTCFNLLVLSSLSLSLFNFYFYNFVYWFQEAKRARLQRFEIPAKIKLLSELWTPESGLVTAALKLKRDIIKKTFSEDLSNLYASWLLRKCRRL